jgi:uncharacterized protein YbjT (DUF2867 family)
MSAILVTGATGNVGSAVVQHLLQRGAKVRAAVLNPETDRKLLPEEVEIVRFDFEDATTYEAAFSGVERLFLMRPPALANVKKQIAPAIEAAKAAGVNHIVFLSLVGVEKNSVVPHYKIEKLLESSGIAWTFLRASFFMQNMNTTHRKEIAERHEIAVPVGHSKTSFIDARDIGAVAAKALTEAGHENRAYTLTGGEALTYDEVAQTFSSVLGKRIQFTNPSILKFIQQQRKTGTPWNFTMVMAMLYTMTRFGTADLVTREVESLLGRKPITLRQYVEDYREVWG